MKKPKPFKVADREVKVEQKGKKLSVVEMKKGKILSKKTVSSPEQAIQVQKAVSNKVVKEIIAEKEKPKSKSIRDLKIELIVDEPSKASVSGVLGWLGDIFGSKPENNPRYGIYQTRGGPVWRPKTTGRRSYNPMPNSVISGFGDEGGVF